MPKWGDQFQKLQKLGEGSSAQIYLVQRKDTKQKMAAKIMKNIQDQPQIDALEMEIKILTNCKHPNIIKCHSVQMFEGELWILMEYCEDGSLADIMNFRKATYSQAQICNILKQILEGLKYLHENNIIHRDIKAGNILHQQGTIKIADFGISIISKGNAVQPKFSRIGSPFWMSPEILSQSIYNTKSDIWALGITAIELAQGEPPYSHQHPFRAIYSIQTHPPQGLKQPQKWSKQFNDFVRYCLTIDYKSRPTAKQLLRHPFLKKGYRIQQSNEMSSQSMSIHHESVEDTIIMYDQQPLSIWQKGSFPQTEQKNGQLQNTVVIKESIEQSLLFSELKNQQQRSGIKESLDIQNKGSTVINNMSLMQRQQKVKQLYLMMEEQIGSVRRKYIQKISQLYVHDYKSNEKEWHSPIKKLKQRSQNLFNNQHARSTSQVFKKML